MTNDDLAAAVRRSGAIDEQISVAPLPTRATLRRRQHLPTQAMRFVALNTRIMRMVLKGHHGG